MQATERGCGAAFTAALFRAVRVLPFFDFHANQAWANIAALAKNLVSWLQLPALQTGHQTRGWDIKRRRYRLFATPGKLITRARRTQLLIPDKHRKPARSPRS